MKGNTYNQQNSTQQGSHSDLTEKSKALQTSKSKENSTPIKKTVEKMVTGTYKSYMNVNGLNAPTKRQTLNGYKNKAHAYAAYERPISDLRTHTGWKWEMEKDIPCKWKSEESWGSNTHIR